MSNACVVIPIHSEAPSEVELLAFAQCFKVLAAHDIYVICPRSLNLSAYRKVVPLFNSVTIDSYWQSSIQNYNLLKRSRLFYNLFFNYNYLLTYELDSFVFKDDLNSWCLTGFDYIGAPWLDGWGEPTEPYTFIGVGNSGFSLRSIVSCLSVLNRLKYLKLLYKYYRNTKLNRLISFSHFLKLTYLSKLFKIYDYKYIEPLVQDLYINEDGFWAIWVAGTFKDFKVAPVEEAMQFSFEVAPEWLFLNNNNILPFGCHAWYKYNPEFWQLFIPFKK